MIKQKKVNRKVSQQKRKQRKRFFRAPMHIARTLMSCRLSTELREKYGKRALPVRKNDVVRVAKGEHKNKEGKVMKVSRNKYTLCVEGVNRKTTAAEEKPFPVHFSACVLVDLFMDKTRQRKLEYREPENKIEEVA